MICPPPTPVNIHLLLTAIAGVPALLAWLSTKLRSTEIVDAIGGDHRKLPTPIGDVALLSDTLKAMGYLVSYDPRLLQLSARNGGKVIEFRGLRDGTWEARVPMSVSDAAFRAHVKTVVTAYARRAQARAAERFRKLAPKFGLEVKSQKASPGKAIEIKAEWVPPKRQAVKVAR